MTRLEEYGVYLEHDGNEILVLIVDVASEPIDDLRIRYSIGEAVPVRILRHIAQTDQYKGSIRDV